MEEITLQDVLEKYNKELEHFTQLINDFSGSKAQLQNAWLNCAKHPLISDLQFSYPAEKELFDACEELNAAKLILMVYGLQMDGIIEVVSPVVPVVPTVNEGEENGTS